MSHLLQKLMMQTAWDIATAGGDVVVIHPRGCGKSQFQENLKKYSYQLKQIRAQKNYLDLADKPKPYSIRIRRQRVKA